MKNEIIDIDDEMITNSMQTVLETHIIQNKNITQFSPENIDSLSQYIINEIMKDLQKSKRIFKYVVTCFIQQRVGAACNFANTNLLEDGADGSISLKASNDYVDVIANVTGVKVTQK